MVETAAVAAESVGAFMGADVRACRWVASC